jgi:hypothetical protein
MPKEILDIEKDEHAQSTARSRGSVSAMVAGAAMMGVGVVGVLSNEARTQDEAVMSIYFGDDHTYFVEAEEIPFIAMGGLGLLTFSLGALSRTREEE